MYELRVDDEIVSDPERLVKTKVGNGTLFLLIFSQRRPLPKVLKCLVTCFQECRITAKVRSGKTPTTATSNINNQKLVELNMVKNTWRKSRGVRIGSLNTCNYKNTYIKNYWL